MRGGSLFPLNPAEIGTSGIDFVDPSPTKRSKPLFLRDQAHLLRL